MRRYPLFEKIVFTLALTVFMIGVFAFRQREKSKSYSSPRDQTSQNSVTDTSRKRSGDGPRGSFDKINDQMKRLGLRMERLNIQMKELDKQMQKLKLNGPEEQLNKTGENADTDKLNEQIEESLKDIDLNEINNSAEKVKMRQLEINEVKKRLQLAGANLLKQNFFIGTEEKEIREELEKTINKKRQSAENLRKQMNNMKQLADQLKKDGIIDNSKALKIEVRNGALFINGIKQSQKLSEKYRHYYPDGDFSFYLSEDDNLRI